MDFLRTRNASDGDSGFDSALSSRSSSISLEESQDLLDFKVSKIVVNCEKGPSLRDQFSHILQQSEDISQDVCTPDLFVIRDRVSGKETLYKPPTKISFNSDSPKIGETYSSDEYNRCNPIPRSQLFNARLQLELEKQVAKMELLEVDLLMDKSMVPPPSLGIRVIGVNMIHGVPDKLNIYVKKLMEGSVAGMDGRIRVTDHIVEVNGVSLVGVSQKLAAETLSNCAVNPNTGIVHFVLAREPPPPVASEPPPEIVGKSDSVLSSGDIADDLQPTGDAENLPTSGEDDKPTTEADNRPIGRSESACDGGMSSTSSTTVISNNINNNCVKTNANKCHPPPDGNGSLANCLVGNSGESKAFIPTTCTGSVATMTDSRTKVVQAAADDLPAQISTIPSGDEQAGRVSLQAGMTDDVMKTARVNQSSPAPASSMAGVNTRHQQRPLSCI